MYDFVDSETWCLAVSTEHTFSVLDSKVMMSPVKPRKRKYEELLSLHCLSNTVRVILSSRMM